MSYCDRATPLTKVALGVFTFALHATPGAIHLSHRYCQQVIEPFLDHLAACPEIRISLAISGWELEFLAAEYPDAFGLLVQLIETDNIELLSGLYAPWAWWALSGRDVEASFEHNRDSLQRRGLVASPVIMLPDGHLGPGLDNLAGSKQFLVCNEKHVRHLRGAPPPGPFCSSRNLVVLFGSNLVTNELERTMRESPASGPVLFDKQSLKDQVAACGHTPDCVVRGTTESVVWYWYHFGGAHHFCSRYSPTAPELFFFDPAWAARCFGVLHRLRGEGFETQTVGDFCHMAYRSDHVAPLPCIVETALNLPERPQDEPSRPLRSALSKVTVPLAWRTRNNLNRYYASPLAADRSQPTSAARSASAQRHLSLGLLYPSSDIAAVPPDFLPFVKANADRAFVLSEALVRPLRVCQGVASSTATHTAVASDAAALIAISFATVEAFGGDALIEWLACSDRLHRCNVRIVSAEEHCGIRFRCAPSTLRYSPLGAEHLLYRLNLAAFALDEITLPLANGLLGLTEEIYVIRDNSTALVPATLFRSDEWVWFFAPGGPPGRIVEWKFIATRTSEDDALALANALNCAPGPHYPAPA